MARKRMIDPSIWTDEGMAELCPVQQILYIGLFSIADDKGRLKASPTHLKLSLPTVLGEIPKADVAAHLDTIVRHMGQLRRYQVDGIEYLYFANYSKWQRIDRPQPSLLPPPDDSTNDPGETTESPANTGETRRTFDDDSTNVLGTVPPSLVKEKRREEKLKETPQTPQGADGGVAAAVVDDGGKNKAPSYTKSFEEFWFQYPSGHGDKKPTFAQWQNLNPDDRIAAMSGLARWRSCELWQRGIIKHAQRWLRDRCFEDDPPPPRPDPIPIHRNGKPTNDDIDSWVKDAQERTGLQ